MNNIKEFYNACLNIDITYGGGMNYDSSFSNPENCPKENADLLAIIYDTICRREMQKKAGFNKEICETQSLIKGVLEYSETLSRKTLTDAIDNDIKSISEKTILNEIAESCDKDNFYNKILQISNINLEYLHLYGIPVTDTEKEMASFWFNRPQELIEKLARHIKNAFLHGFISQSRDRAGRKNVRLVYALGQEALAKEVVRLFAIEDNIEVIILKPSSLGVSGQYAADHKFDAQVYSADCYPLMHKSYKDATEQFQEKISQTCGFIRIGTFGGEIENISACSDAFIPESEQIQASRELQGANRNIEASLLKPDTLSFCSVVFPDLRVGKERFDNMFEAFCNLNTADSDPVERIQAELIDMLDSCERVILKGGNGNKTDISVSLAPINNKEKETLFLNCGGDLNIPHGEMFTTPRLTGTSGVLHVREIFLRENFYKDLYLRFEEGIVVEFGCKNFESDKENKEYVFDRLLNRCEKTPMGELSIGTNTEAYKLANDFNLFPILPILLAEKMGPHIAVGDPCFARGEDSPVYNIYGGREMIARENELTAKRKTSDCYVNFHTDITIPFSDMALFAGVKSDGEELPIIKDGKFVAKCADSLNKYL